MSRFDHWALSTLVKRLYDWATSTYIKMRCFTILKVDNHDLLEIKLFYRFSKSLESSIKLIVHLFLTIQKASCSEPVNHCDPRVLSTLLKISYCWTKSTQVKIIFFNISQWFQKLDWHWNSLQKLESLTLTSRWPLENVFNRFSSCWYSFI